MESRFQIGVAAWCLVVFVLAVVQPTCDGARLNVTEPLPVDTATLQWTTLAKGANGWWSSYPTGQRARPGANLVVAGVWDADEDMCSRPDDDPKCPWPRGFSWNQTDCTGACIRWVDQELGRNFRFSAYGYQFTTMDWFISILYGGMVILHVRRWRADPSKRPFPMFDPSFYPLIIPTLGYFILGASCIDPWSFFENFSAATFLGLYAPAYGMVLSTPVLMSTYILETFIYLNKKEVGTKRRVTRWLIIIFLAVGAFTTLGYLGYGIGLAHDFALDPDPNNKMAQQGDKMVWTMYGLTIVSGAGCAIMVTTTMSGHIAYAKKYIRSILRRLAAKSDMTDEEKKEERERILATSTALAQFVSIQYRMTVYGVGCVLIAFWCLATNLLRYAMSNEQGISDHIDFHYNNRYCEVSLGLLIYFTILAPGYQLTNPLKPYMWLFRRAVDVCMGRPEKQSLFNFYDGFQKINTASVITTTDGTSQTTNAASARSTTVSGDDEEMGTITPYETPRTSHNAPDSSVTHHHHSHA